MATQNDAQWMALPTFLIGNGKRKAPLNPRGAKISTTIDRRISNGSTQSRKPKRAFQNWLSRPVSSKKYYLKTGFEIGFCKIREERPYFARRIQF